MSDCIEWKGPRDVAGYGRVSANGKTKLAHRVAWEDTHGEIETGLCICHHCDNPPCINVEHLFIGTKGDNLRDMAAKGRNWQQKKTHCPRGHEYTPENTYIGTNGRECKSCWKIRSKANYYKDVEASREKGRETALRHYHKKVGSLGPDELALFRADESKKWREWKKNLSPEKKAEQRHKAKMRARRRREANKE